MAIINTEINEGAEIKVSAEASETFVASKVVLDAGVKITQRDLISAVAGGILMSIIRG